jgi:hypothetical protein
MSSRKGSSSGFTKPSLRKQGTGLGPSLAAVSEMQEGDAEAGGPTVALQIGDVVYLSVVGGAVSGGVVHAEGFMDCRIGLLPPDEVAAGGALGGSAGGADGSGGRMGGRMGATPEQLLRGRHGDTGGADIGPHAGMFTQESHFRSCLFRVTNCCQYAAQENYRRFQEAERQRTDHREQQHLERRLKELQRKQQQ